MTIQDLVDLEKKTTQGEWFLRQMKMSTNDCFIERPIKTGEAYGREIMSDEDYETKIADARFIVACKKYFMERNSK